MAVQQDARPTRWVRIPVMVLLALALTIGPAPTASAEQRLREVSIEVSCVQHVATTELYADADVDHFNGRRLDWALSGPGSDRSGQLRWFPGGPDEEGSYDDVHARLSPGRYRLTITRADRNEVVVDQVFDVLRCVTTKLTCRAITFRNPPGNRTVRVTWKGSDYLDGKDSPNKGTLTLRPGRSATVRTFYPEIFWRAEGPDSADHVLYNGGSEAEVEIDQHCGPTRTRGVASCATGRRGLVRAWLHPPDHGRLRYRVEDFYEKERVGRVGHDRRVAFRLKPSSSYFFFSYTSATAQPYDRAEPFVVAPCVVARKRAGAVRFRNPGESTVRVAYRVVGKQDKIVFRLEAGKARTAVVPPGELRWHTNALRTVSRWRTDRGRGVLQISS